MVLTAQLRSAHVTSIHISVTRSEVQASFREGQQIIDNNNTITAPFLAMLFALKSILSTVDIAKDPEESLYQSFTSNFLPSCFKQCIV